MQITKTEGATRLLMANACIESKKTSYWSLNRAQFSVSTALSFIILVEIRRMASNEGLNYTDLLANKETRARKARASWKERQRRRSWEMKHMELRIGNSEKRSIFMNWNRRTVRPGIHQSLFLLSFLYLFLILLRTAIAILLRRLPWMQIAYAG